MPARIPVCNYARPHVRLIGRSDSSQLERSACWWPRRRCGLGRVAAWRSSSCRSQKAETRTLPPRLTAPSTRAAPSTPAVPAPAATSTERPSAWRASVSRAVKSAMPTATATRPMDARRPPATTRCAAAAATCRARRRAAVRLVQTASVHRPVYPGALPTATAIRAMAARRT